MCFGSAESIRAQLVQMTSAQLAKDAQAIVRGTVKTMKSEWNDEKTFIWTFVTLAVSETIKGKDMRGEDTEIKIPGGIVGEIGQRSSDEVTFRQGEEVVVFLGKETYKRKEYFNVIGLVQGKLTVEDGKIRGRPVKTFLQEITQALEQEKR
jgi:hypothetical protein